MPVDIVTGNPYDDLVGKWTGMAGIAAHSDASANPDEAASALTTSKESGIPPQITGLDPNAFAAELKAKKNADLVKGNPALSTYVNTVPLASKVSNDDFDKLDAVHKALLLSVQGQASNLSAERGGFGPLNPLVQGFTGTAASESLGLVAALPGRRDFFKPLIEGLRGISDRAVQTDHSAVGTVEYNVGSMAGQLVTDFLSGGLAQGVAGLIGGPVGAGIGTATGMASAAALASHGRALDEQDQADAANGTKTPEIEKQLKAGVIGVATGALFSLGLHGPAADLIQTAVRDGIATALPRIALDTGATAALGAGINGTLQEVHDLVMDAGKPGEETVFNSEEKRAALADKVRSAMVDGALYMGLAHVFGIGSNVIGDRLAIRAADQAAEQHKAAMNAADATETKTRSPEAFRQFAEIAARDKTVSIPADKIDELNMADTIRPLVPDFDEQINLGRASGGDVTIPYSAYLAGVDGSMDAKMAKDLRHERENLTQNEAQELKDQIAKLNLHEPEAPIIQTRGLGVQYHGTSAVELQPDNSHYSTLNYYGQGFYSTDAADTAYGYSKRGANATGQRNVYEITPKRDLNIYDAEQPFDKKILSAIRPKESSTSELDGVVLDSLDESKNLRELYDNIRDNGTNEGFSADTIQEIFDILNEKLRGLGYEGISHKGGLRTKTPEHRVVIYFNPEKDLNFRKMPAEELRPPISSKIPERPETATPPPEAATIHSEQVSDTTAKELYLAPLFPTNADAGMTKPMFERYSLLIEQRHVAQNEAALKAARIEIRRRDSQAWKDTVGLVRDELASKLAPEWAAHDFITKRILDGKEVPSDVPTKLDRAAVERLTSDSLPRGTTVKGGVDPEEMAQLLGYRSGHELVQALAGLEKGRGDETLGQYRKRLLDEATAKEMETRFGKFDDEIEREARATAMQHSVQEALHIEMQALGDKIGAPPFKLDAMRDFVKEQFDRKSVKETRQLKAFSRMVGAEGRRAEMHLLAKNYQKAFQAKQKQLVAHLMAAEAERFDREATKAIKRFDRLRRKASFKSLDQDYLNQIHGLLFRFGMGVKRNPAELTQTLSKQSLADFVKRKEAELGPDQLMVSPDLMVGPTESLKYIPVERFRELSDAIKSLETHGRNEKTIMLKGERESLDNVIDQTLANLEALSRRWPKGKKRGLRESTNSVVKSLDSYLLRFEELVDDLDRLDPEGILNQVYRETLVKGKHKEYDLLNEATKLLKEIAKDDSQYALESEIIDSKLFRDRRSPMRPPLELSRMDWRVIAANLGNKGNAQKMARGYDVRESDIRAEANRILNEKDWKWVNGVWDFFKWLRPMIEDKAVRTTGVAPDPVNPTPFVTKFGRASGGYFPLMYDPEMGGKSLSEAAKRHGLFDPNYKSSTPDKSYMRSRVENYTNFVHIQGVGGRLPAEIRSVIHDLAMHEPLVEIRKLLTNERVVDAIERSRGPEYAKLIDPFLRDQANRFNTEDQRLQVLTSFSRAMRQNLTTAVLGFNLKTIFTPNTGHLGRVLGLLGGRPLDTINALMNSTEATKFANENSPELRHWIEDKNREINELYGQMTGISSLRFDAARAAIISSTFIERKIATIEWHAEYQAAMREGKDEDTAFALADKAIRMNYGRGGPLDQPAIMRAVGEQGRWLTLFYGFGNLMYNRTRRVVKLGESGVQSAGVGDWVGARRDFAAALGQTISFVLVPAIFGAVYNQIKPSDSWGAAAGKLLAGQLTQTVPGIGPAAQAILQGRDINVSGPAISTLQYLERSGTDILHALHLKKGNVSPSWVKHAMMTTAILAGLPGGVQGGNLNQFIWDWAQHNQAPQTFGQWVNGILYGNIKGQNPK